jgi:hypothetical protein
VRTRKNYYLLSNFCVNLSMNRNKRQRKIVPNDSDDDQKKKLQCTSLHLATTTETLRWSDLKRGSAKGEPNVAGEKKNFLDFIFANERSNQTIDKSKILAHLVLPMKNASWNKFRGYILTLKNRKKGCTECFDIIWQSDQPFELGNVSFDREQCRL